MTTLTGNFIPDILKKNGKTVVDDETLSEAEKIINEEMSEKRKSFRDDVYKKHDKEYKEYKAGNTTVISEVAEGILLQALEKLGKTEIDEKVFEEAKVLYDERIAKKFAKKQTLKR
ncbi:MAG TPA: hypothetical protein VIM42_04345 [Clostridium sp.]